jgi:hypothetical protein
MPWSVVRFGKHKGKTLPQIVFADPDWFFWAVEEHVFRDKGRLAAEAADLDRKARAIRIPPSEGEDRIVEYIIHLPTGKFSDIDIVPAEQPRHEGSSPTFRLKVIDLSVPRRIGRYDKLGYRTLIGSVKVILFGSSRIRLTKERCESFFDNQNNFELAQQPRGGPSAGGRGPKCEGTSH